MVFSLTTPLWASLVAQLVKNQPSMQETWVRSLGWEDPWRRKQLPTPVFWPGEYHGLYSPWGCKELNMTVPLGRFKFSYSVQLWAKVSTFQPFSFYSPGYGEMILIIIHTALSWRRGGKRRGISEVAP